MSKIDKNTDIMAITYQYKSMFEIIFIMQSYDIIK